MFSFLKRQKMQNIITLKIEKEANINLNDLSAALYSLNHLIETYSVENLNNKISLELYSVEKGSDIFNFIINYTPDLINALKAAIDNIKNIFDIIKSIKEIDNTTLKETQENKNYTKQLLNDSKNIINIAKNAKVTIINNNNCLFEITPQEYKKYIESYNTICNLKGYDNKTTIKKVYNDMIIEFYQTTNTTNKNIKHKVICNDITNKAIPSIIQDENLNKEMLENPYNYMFLVDIEIYINNQNNIKAYRIFNYKEKLEKE